MREIAYNIATDALMKPLQGDIRIIIYGGRLSTVETSRHIIRFFAKHLAYTEHQGHSWNPSWGFDVEEKLYITSNHSTKISFYAPEGKEKETVEKITQFIEHIMADAGLKPIPRFTLKSRAPKKD